MRDKYEILRRIKAAGCPIEVDVPAVASEAEIAIIQNGDAFLFDAGIRGIAIALWVRLVRAKPGQITIAEFGDIYLPWGTLGVMWLDRSLPPSLPIYRLPNGFDFPAYTVLNHRLEEGGLRLRNGRFVEGYVLGTALERIPEKHSHGAVLDAEFSLLDALGHEFRGPVRLLVDRSTAPLSQRHSARPGLGDPGEWAPGRAIDPVERPRLDTLSQRNQPGGSLGDAKQGMP